MSSSAWQEDARQIFAKYERSKGGSGALEKHALRGLLDPDSPAPSATRPATPGVKKSKSASTTAFDFDIDEIVDSFSKLDHRARVTSTRSASSSSSSSSSSSMNRNRKSGMKQRKSSFDFESKEAGSEDEEIPIGRRMKSSSRSRSRTKSVKPRHRRGRSAKLRERNKVARHVHFSKMVSVCFISDAEEDKEARRGPWESAPEDDELWDGDLQDFRKVPLTPEELHKLLERKAIMYGEGGAFAQRFDVGEFQQDSSWAVGIGLPMEDAGFYDFGYMDEQYYDAYHSMTPMFKGDVPSASRMNDGGFMHVDMRRWSTNEVCAWLRLNVEGGEYFVDIFQEHEVDGEVFKRITERSLRALGIKRNADRSAIVEARDLHLRMYSQT